MTTLLAQTLHAEPVMLTSFIKPLLMLLVLGGWAWVVSYLDKDLAYFFLPRQMWNGIQMGAGALAASAEDGFFRNRFRQKSSQPATMFFRAANSLLPCRTRK